jgi:hypothetical protein
MAQKRGYLRGIGKMVGATGFEPATNGHFLFKKCYLYLWCDFGAI